MIVIVVGRKAGWEVDPNPNNLSPAKQWSFNIRPIMAEHGEIIK